VKEHFRKALKLSCIAVILSALFLFIHWMFGPFELYPYVLAPGNLLAKLFTEEIDFWPKIGTLMVGQFVFCFAFFFLALKLKSVVSCLK
jgi:hypothetical protein